MLAASLSLPRPASKQRCSANIKAAVADSNRPDADKARDATVNRRNAGVLGEAREKVGELLGRLFHPPSAWVGAKGHVCPGPAPADPADMPDLAKE